MSITIRTAVADAIYRSHGGGQTHTVHEAATGPRNLLRLAGMLSDERRQATAAYGNVGHIATWLEIDGVRIDSHDVADLDEADEATEYGPAPRTRSAKATALIARVQSGAYVRDRAIVDQAIADELDAMDPEGA